MSLGGELFTSCGFINGREVGLLRVDAALAEECLPCCDLNDPIVCPGQGQVCAPLFKEGEAPWP